MTLKDEITSAMNFYNKHSEQLVRRAKSMTPGSNIQNETLLSAKLNSARAKAMHEALEIIEKYVG